MRYLLIALALALPTTAMATPCGTQGTNVPLTAQTRATPETQQSQQVIVVPGQGPTGSLNAPKQAYPH
jgi:hypothetical protein